MDGVPYNPHDKQRVYNVTYRIDLNAGRFCKLDCSETKQLARVTPTEIVFTDISSNEGTVLEMVNRESGLLFFVDTASSQSGRPMGVAISAQCERHPFTGFPTRKF